MDKILWLSGKEVVDADVRDVLGFIPSEILDRTLDALVARDSRAMLENVGIVVDQGLNLQQYVREFISRIRDMLVLKLGLEDKVIGSAEEKRALAARAERFSEQDLIRFFDALLRLENELRWTSLTRFHLEVGFVKLAKIGYVKDIEDVLRDVKQGGGEGATSAPRRPLTSPTTPKPAPSGNPEPAPAEKTNPSSDTFTFADIFTRRVESKSPAASHYLQKSERIERTEGTAQEVFASATSHPMLQSKEFKSVLDAVASELIGKPVSVSLIMKEQQQPNVAGAETAKDEPLVKKFLEVFRGDLAQVKPSKGE